MNNQQIEIKNTRYYQIVNLYYKYALYITSGSNNFKQQTAFLMECDQSSLGQIWQIILVDPEGSKAKNLYQIVHARSTLVLTKVQQSQAKLRFGKWDPTQLFYMQKVNSAPQPNVYRFISNQNRSLLLHYDKFLKIGLMNPEDQRCQWIIYPQVHNKIINRSCYLENAFSNLCVDVPEGSQKEGTKLIQYEFNNRFNQRFNIYEYGNYFKIANINSKMFLTCSKKCKQGDYITQQNQAGVDQDQQKWKIEYNGRNLFYIRPALNPEMMLGKLQKSIKNLSFLVTTKNQQMSLWKIVGYIPKKHEIYEYDKF